MTGPPIEVRVAVPDLDAGWVADLVARAGVPARAVATAEPRGDGPWVELFAPVTAPDDWLRLLLESVPEQLSVATVSCAVVAEDDLAVLARAASRMPELGAAPVLDEPLGPCVLHLAGEAPPGAVHLLSDRLVVGHARAQEVADRSPAEHALRWAARCTHGLSLTLDARSLDGGVAGTQVHTLELIRALVGQDDVRLRVVLPPKSPRWVHDHLAGMDGVEMRTYDEVVNAGIRTDVVHRPYQVFTLHDLRLLERLGRRIVVTQQDQLLYRNPGYHASPEDWDDYRQTCRIALAWATRTVFFSQHARREALRDELVDPARAVVVPIGVDRTISAEAGAARRPEVMPGGTFLLVLGTDLAHKNHTFAVALARVLREAHGWDGTLVFAGPHADHGATATETAGEPAIHLGPVEEEERRWLLEHCTAVVFPSTDEGFGLVPFEAALAGKPCLYAPVASLAELAAGTATLVPWDPVASARAAAPLLAEGPARDDHVTALAATAHRYRWADTAAMLVAVYDDALRAPERSASQLAAVHSRRQAEYHEMRLRLGEDAMSLIGPDGALPPDAVRPLLAAASRPAVARPLFAALKLLYRMRRRAG